MTKEAKLRLDVLVLKRFSHLSRTFVQSLIMQGKVSVDGVVMTKAGTLVSSSVELDVKESTPKYVSRAGFKLEKALDHFGFDVQDLIVLDAGISTGGFTDCLLQRGAKKVYGVDVGYGQVHEKLRNDPRVVLMERTNLRHLDSLPDLVDLVTLDLSFISILKVMPAVKKLLKPQGKIITLIKPQFEAERKDIARGGVVKNAQVLEEVKSRIEDGMKAFGYTMEGVIESPIRGAVSGNIEFLALFTLEK